jgi:hypothetical protein
MKHNHRLGDSRNFHPFRRKGRLVIATVKKLPIHFLNRAPVPIPVRVLRGSHRASAS